MESKTCISTLSAEDLRLHLLSTNKLPAGIPEKLLVGILRTKENYNAAIEEAKISKDNIPLSGVQFDSPLNQYEANVEVLQLTLGHKMKLLSFIKTIKSQQPQEQEKESTGIVACDPTIEYEPIVNENQILDIIVTDQPSNNNVIDFNVIDILNATDEGKVIVQNYLERLEAFITEKERITIVQILVNRLVTLTGKLDLFPPTEKRKNLGEAIVAAFPCLGINVDGKVFSCHFYNQTTGSGFIETRLKRLREVHREEPRRKRPTQDSSPIQKKPRVTKRPHVKKNADYIFNEAECQFKVEWLKSHPPGGDNDTVIIEYSKATFGYRQKEIKQTLTEPGLIMKEYPRFKDFQNGSLFQVEFQLLYPDAKNFEKVFKEKFLFKILALANKKNIDIPDCPDECLKAVFVLLKLTPSIVKLRKVNFRLITERLIVFLKDNADLIQLSETRDPHLKQPFICCMGTMETPTNFWIVIDRDIILCGNDFATAFVNLFCSFYAFNLNFPQYLESFYGFF
ncbi:uncharacterized protein LOC116926976 isoform X4 [Daphnia magna]|uniref:uncharacterized protein LOC116926976 isoform X4 n=1 Tax=Daphnia magna TaxID=35525 RepID=UPI001E1BDC03|nr:uncharacterized protein LOC116926976 isoform X4 [Daphnia magna]